jgi:hypothetical protein
MGWKNWGDHPVVVTVSLVAGLAGLISLGYTIASAPSANKEPAPVPENKTTPAPISKQDTQGDNSPAINSNGGNVNLNIDNSTKVETREKPEAPKYSGRIGNGKEGKGFTEFIYKNDGKIVYLDTYYMSSSNNINDVLTGEMLTDSSTKDREGSFIIANECEGEVPSNVPPHRYCGGYSYQVKMPNNSDSLYTFNMGAYYLKGYWSVRTHPGTIQGVIYVTLSAVDAKDVQ